MVDWEGLKALRMTQISSLSSGGIRWATEQLSEALLDAYPALLAEHERDQRVIAAAEKLAAAVVAKVTPHNYQSVVAEALAEYDKAKQS